MAASIAPSHEPELEGIKNVRDLPGDWLVDEWATFDPSEAQSLADSLHPRIVKLLRGDEAEFQALIDEKGFWRDIVALSWSFRTFHGKDKITSRIPSLLARAGIKDIQQASQIQVINLPNQASILRIAVPFTTSNPDSKCLAIFKFVRKLDGEIKLFTTTTQLVEVAAAPWKDCVNTRPVSKELPERTDVLVIGGGHAGLSIGAYLSALGLDFAILDAEREVGDAWARRYDSATLHTTRIFSGLPYRPFPDTYDEYVKAKQLATFYKQYAEELKLPIYQNNRVEKAVFDEDKKEWTVTTSNNDTLKARILLFSVGIGGRFPVRPTYPGADEFKGEQMHSMQYTNPSAWKGKKVVVIGSSTTGLDVGLDCSELGIDVTIVQRGATRIYGPGHIAGLQKLFWNENSSAEMGDQITSEDPLALQEKLSALLMKHQTSKYDKKYYEGLEKAGFLALHEGAVHNQIFIHGGKHYPDIGAGWAICRGEIKVKSDSTVTNLDATGVNFADGTHLDADAIVYATGFKKDTREVLSGIIGDQYKLEPVWGLDKEGEVRGVFRPTGHDHIWQNGGELQIMRQNGKFLAMQIAALLKGVRPEPVRT